MTRAAAFLLACLFLTTSVLPATAADKVTADQLARVERVFKTAKMNGIFENIRKGWSNVPIESFEKGQIGAKEFHAKFVRVARESFDPKIIRQFVVEQLAADVDADIMDKVIAFYSTDLGQRLAALDAETTSPEFITAIQQNLDAITEELDRHPDRKAIFSNVIETFSAVEMNQAIVGNYLYAMFTAMAANRQLPGQMDDQQIRAAVKQSIAGSRENISKMLHASFFTSYATVSLQDLKTYEQFAVQKSSQQFFAAFFSSFELILTSESRKFGTRLATALNEKDA